MKKILGLLVLVVLVAACAWRIAELQKRKAAESKKTGTGAPLPVLLASAVSKPMPVEIRTFGTVEPATTVTIRAQVTGTLSAIGFAEGAEVHAGDLLFRIDPRPFQAALDQAVAAHARTQAQLENAARDVRRVTDLFDKKFVSESDHDQAVTALAALQASERADAAAIESTRIQLDYCAIRSPIDGRTGRRQVDAGNLVTANSTTLVTINQLRPVHVTFAVPEQDLARLRACQQNDGLSIDVFQPDDPGRTEAGRLVFLDNAVDRATGTLTLKAEFANADNWLWPGSFVNVRLVTTVETNACVIPFTAVQNSQQGTYVFVVRPDATVEVRPVTVSRTVGGESVIAAGLQPGDKVVTDGQQRLGPGASVKNAVSQRVERKAP